MNSNKTVKTSGIGFAGLLQIVFIVLKLCGVIEWKWIWVLAPSWIWFILLVLIVILIGVIEKWQRLD